MIILRFVRHDDPASSAIIWKTGGNFSHVEAVTPDGKYLGAFGEKYKYFAPGTTARPMDYDSGKFAAQRFLALQADDDMRAKWIHYLRACIGEPYDWGGLSATIIAHIDFHDGHHVFCSALQTLALRGCSYLKTALPVLAHDISPRDLELGLSMRDDVREIKPDDPEFIAHINAGL
jgi:hypothetical protein